MRRKVFWRMWCLRQERASLPQGSMNDISPTKGKNITISWTLHRIPGRYRPGLCHHSVRYLSPGRCFVHNVLPIGHRERNGVGRAVGRCGSTFSLRRKENSFRLPAIQIIRYSNKRLEKDHGRKKFFRGPFPPLPHSYEKIFFLNKK